MTLLSGPQSQQAPIASTSQQAFERHPLKEKRRRLVEKQSQITHIERIKSQLQQLSPSANRTGWERPISSATSSWSVASNGSDGSFVSEIKGSEILVPLCGVAFVPASIHVRRAEKTRGGNAEGSKDFLAVFLRSDGSGNDDLIKLSVAQDEVKSGRYKEMTIDEAIAHLEITRQTIEREISVLRDEVVSVARATLMEHLGGVHDDQTGLPETTVNEQGQALNEEGLPFVDLIEPIIEGKESKTRVAALPIMDREPMTKEARKRWMDSVLDNLEEEEVGEKGAKPGNGVIEQPTSPKKPIDAERAPLHRRLSSADRPAPIKSVLKQTGPVAPPIPKFGSSGIRRGFLNLNPSSPAAEHSSDPVENWTASDTAMSQSLNSLSNEGGRQGEGSASDSMDERMSRSTDSFAREKTGQQKKKLKKTVRIQSPSRSKGESEASSSAFLSQRKSIRTSNDDMEDEAKSILELLGLDAIKGHPQAAGLYEALKDSEKMKELASKAEAARLVAIEKEKQKSMKSAVSRTVTERSNVTDTEEAHSTGDDPGKRMSGFRKGFLQSSSPLPPTAPAAATLPAAPRTSQGVSALERATQSDHVMEDERVKKGLKPAVPHARPSKAYAEKLEAKEKGDSNHEPRMSKKEAKIPARTSQVRFSDEQPFLPSSTLSKETIEDEDVDMKDDDDGTLDSIGMEISEEDLDEDTVEALGYFSDEEYDPDIGFDEDDLMQSTPQFRGDASELANEELRAEYERMKVVLGSRNHHSGYGVNETSEDEDDFLQGKDLSLAENEREGDKVKVSRFKQDQVKRALSGQKIISSELGPGLQGAKNVGPSMLIPSIANVRFPTQGQKALAEGQEVQLDGQDDEEDDQLEEIMRMRLTQQQQGGTEYKNVKPNRHLDRPPTVLTTEKSIPATQKESHTQAKPATLSSSPSLPPTPPSQTSPSQQPPQAKKPSPFKMRMSQQ
ncbi:hypothetical protein CBS101457_002462 [Exobasidium rhododendri]|nr:hypothetical protein CBS101457_002462 [Exobasidium rhododendri]